MYAIRSYYDKEANWLPAPKGPFNLTMRLYGPKSVITSYSIHYTKLYEYFTSIDPYRTAAADGRAAVVRKCQCRIEGILDGNQMLQQRCITLGYFINLRRFGGFRFTHIAFYM